MIKVDIVNQVISRTGVSKAKAEMAGIQVGIEIKGLAKIVFRLGYRVRVQPVQQFDGTEGEVVGTVGFLTPFSYVSGDILPYPLGESRGNPPRNFVLNREFVIDFAVVAIRSDVISGRGID